MVLRCPVVGVRRAAPRDERQPFCLRQQLRGGPRDDGAVHHGLPEAEALPSLLRTSVAA